jgi:trans-aconitate methyltransferase
MQSVNKQTWDAEDYSKNSSAQLQWARELIAKLNLRGNESVLDIGCGDGKVTVELARIVKTGKVLGIDLSENMIKIALKQFPSSENPNFSFLQMDATEIQLSEKVDIVFSNAVLHWVKDHSAVLRGVRSCIKDNGRILFQMGGRGNATEVFNAIELIIKKTRWYNYFENFKMPYYFYGPDDYKIWLSENGFNPVRVELIPKDMQHNQDGFLGWLRTTWFPYTDCLPVELRDEFLADVIKAYSDVHPVDASGNMHVKMMRLEVEAIVV